MGQLNGQRVLITGAGAGLGRAIAVRFVREGAVALALLDVDEEGLEETSRQVADAGTLATDVEVTAHRVDVTDRRALGAAFGATHDLFGGLDVVINNAGILSPSARLHNVRTEDFRRVLDVNVIGVFHGIQAAVEVMRKKRRGTIINTASVSGLTAWSHAGPYCASKAAVIQLTKVAAVEYAAEGLTVNCVCPGTFRSAIHEGMSDIALDGIASRHPVGRLADVEEITGAFVYLASPDASFTTGAAVIVDGGYSAL